MDALGHSKVVRLFVMLTTAMSVAGCELFNVVCTRELRSGIRAVVVDASSGEPVFTSGTTVVASGGAVVDTADMVSVSGVADLFVGEGRYRIEVSAPGYERWTQEGVEVHEDECGPIATELEAQLMPEG